MTTDPPLGTAGARADMTAGAARATPRTARHSSHRIPRFILAKNARLASGKSHAPVFVRTPRGLKFLGLRWRAWLSAHATYSSSPASVTAPQRRSRDRGPTNGIDRRPGLPRVGPGSARLERPYGMGRDPSPVRHYLRGYTAIRLGDLERARSELTALIESPLFAAGAVRTYSPRHAAVEHMVREALSMIGTSP